MASVLIFTSRLFPISKQAFIKVTPVAAESNSHMEHYVGSRTPLFYTLNRVLVQ